MAVSRSRKWQITINNPDEHEINSDVINKIMKEISWQYYCFAYEIGEQEHTPHIHLYFVCTNAVSFDRLKKLFPCAHLEACKGTSQDNRNYIRKEGKHSDKRITSLLDTFEEYGEMPLEVATKMKQFLLMFLICLKTVVQTPKSLKHIRAIYQKYLT